MTPETAELLARVRQLPVDEQLDLADAIYDALDHDAPLSDIDRMTDEEFVAELDRRAEEARRDPSCMVPWDEVKKML